MICADRIKAPDKLRLAMLYALRYEDTGNLRAVKSRLLDSGLTQEKVDLLDALLQYSGVSFDIGLCRLPTFPLSVGVVYRTWCTNTVRGPAATAGGSHADEARMFSVLGCRKCCKGAGSFRSRQPHLKAGQANHHYSAGKLGLAIVLDGCWPFWAVGGSMFRWYKHGAARALVDACLRISICDFVLWSIRWCCFQGVENVYAQHVPLIMTTVEAALKGKLKDSVYPAVGSSGGKSQEVSKLKSQSLS